jgi:hypothetical protein
MAGEDNYSDTPDNESAEPTPDNESQESNESPRGLLPKSILMGKDFKPGDEIVLKIDAIHDDEVEVSYATEKKEAGGGGTEEAAAPEKSSAASGMASMME